MDRNKYFFDNRIVLVALPTTDTPSETHEWGWYYSEGTYQFYSLFQWNYKIRTVKSLVWHFRVIKYLNYRSNKDFNDEKLLEACRRIADIKNKFITFEVSNDRLKVILDGVLKYDCEEPPINALRKIVFKPFLGMSKVEKQRIVGSFSGKKSKITLADIYEIMININESGVKIKMKDLAKNLGCSDRTIRRIMTEELKNEIKELNESI